MEQLNIKGVKLKEQKSIKAYLKNATLANLMYIILWLAFDAFFIYILTMRAVSQQFWFVLITVCGLNLLAVWIIFFKVLKLANQIKNSEYILTEDIIYYCENNTYKTIKKIEIKDIVVLEKSEYVCDGFYIATENDYIKVENIINEKQFFDEIAQSIIKKD